MYISFDISNDTCIYMYLQCKRGYPDGAHIRALRDAPCTVRVRSARRGIARTYHQAELITSPADLA
jgi:hypothetical protein